ncbi:MAG TPA: CHAT domain-containing protein [Myxococcota bacterium]|nr:CHAT domain-containing protein [Myxococcota bacterium]HRY97056.1 CHAT domain-containing protein [Myxococcota bacterium]HSA20975.1 CHAT domain-containing protein [Myxococcota bacterium]
MRCLAIVCTLLLLTPLVASAEPLEALHARALRAYDQAMEHFGVALGERAEDGSAVRRLLTAQVAELTCLRGSREGCLQASSAAGRALGEYLGPLEPGGAPEPARWARARAFVLEVYRLSEGWGLDNALASEALGLFARLEGDHHRAQARAAGQARLDALVLRARKASGVEALSAWAEAFRLAELMLDEAAQVKAAQGLAGALLSLGPGGLPPGADAAALRRALLAGQDRLAILGQDDAVARGALAQALERVQTRELAAPDLVFDALPAAERFEVDLGRAAGELRELAGRAPLRSRASALLHFFAAYAGSLAAEPGAAEPLVALSEVLALTDPYLAARAAGLRGREALLAGDFHRAARLLEEAAERLGSLPGAAAVAGLLQAAQAQALFYLGQYGLAAEAFGEAAAHLAERPAGATQAYLGQAHALLFAGQLPAAEETLRRAEGLLARVGAEQRPSIARSLRLDRALADLSAGRGEQALAGLRAVAEEARQAGDVRAGAVAHTNLAELLNDRGAWSEGLGAAEAALAWLDPASQADAAWQAWTEKGRALAGLGQGAAAQRAFGSAMDLVEGLRARIGAEGARRSFAAAKARLYRAAVAGWVDLGDRRQAFLVAERARGRAFLDMLAERQLTLGDRERQARLGPARERLLRDLPRPELVLEEPAAGLAPARTGARPAPVRPDPRSDWRSLVSVNPAGVDDVRGQLARGEALVACFHDGRRLHSFLVHAGGVELESAEVDEETLQNRTLALLRLLRDPRSDEAAIREKGERLLTLMLGGLRPRLAAFRRLTFVPWGPLHYLPLGALWDGQAYLLDRHELAAVPSASALVMLRARLAARGGPKGAPRVLALGDPASDLPALPAAQAEVRLIGGLFGGAQAEVGGRATKRLFLERAPGAGLIHLASHGVFLPGRPMESYLALAGDSPELGRLRALDVLGVDLRQARLVTLSACSSGEVQVEQGDELTGLTRAFLHAGAPALLAALWPLEDRAALGLVDRLYRELRGGKAPAAAWALAARELKSRPEHAHPFFWAPLQLVGS